MNSNTIDIRQKDDSLSDNKEIVQVHTRAPNFLITSVEGDSFDLYNYIEGGYGLIVSFPRDDMIDLAALCAISPDIMKRNTRIIGLSPESEEELSIKLLDLTEKYQIPISFPIICDSDLKVLTKYGFVLNKKGKQIIQKGLYIIRGHKVEMTAMFPPYYTRNFRILTDFIDSFQSDLMNEERNLTASSNEVDNNSITSSKEKKSKKDKDSDESPFSKEFDNQPRRTSLIDQKNMFKLNPLHPRLKQQRRSLLQKENSLLDISNSINHVEPIHEKLKNISKSNLETLEFSEEEMKQFSEAIKRIPLHKTKIEEDEVLAFEGRIGFEVITTELKLPSRFHTENIMNFLLARGSIVPLFPTKFGKKDFKNDKTLYTPVNYILSKKEDCMKPCQELLNPKSFASVVKFKVTQVKHLDEKNTKFLSGKKYFWEIMVGKDIIHTNSTETSSLLEEKDHVVVSFPVFYSNQTLNISLVKKKFHQSSNLHRFEASIALSQITQNPKSYWVSLIDKLTLDTVGKLKINIYQTFLHGTSDENTHVIPALYPPSFYEQSPVDLAKLTVQNNPKYNKKSMVFGEPNHRCCIDFVIGEDEKDDVKLEGFFKFGVTTASAGLFVELFLQDGDTYIHRGKWKSYGVTETQKGGRVEFTVPHNAFSKRTRVYMVMLNDFTYARGCVWVLKRGTKAVIFDLDGTVSTHDMELIKTLIGEPLKIHYDGEERNGARFCVNYWWALGYLPIYLSGRAGSYYELTLKWLENHNFPPGLIGHTLDSIPTLPIYKVLGSERLGVGTFKLSYLNNLRVKYGLEYRGAYGNTSTDSKVYNKLGVPQEQIFMLSGGGMGFRHGKIDYVDIGRDYMNHFDYLDNLEVSPVRIPTTYVSW